MDKIPFALKTLVLFFNEFQETFHFIPALGMSDL